MNFQSFAAYATLDRQEKKNEEHSHAYTCKIETITQTRWFDDKKRNIEKKMLGAFLRVVVTMIGVAREGDVGVKHTKK